MFIINEKTGKVVSSIGLIPGVKGEPYVSEDMPKGFGLETDNILAEFNIPPVTTCEGFITNLNYMKDYIRNFVKKVNPDYNIKCAAYEVVDEDQLQSDEAKLFGCDPDYNCYTESENPKPNGAVTNGRSAGYHIHLGYENNNPMDSLRLVKYFDLYLGLPSILYDQDTRRRTLYGKAGSFRLQPWGVEYRPLSAAMYANEKLMHVVWNGIIQAIEAYNANISLPDPGLVCQAINNSDVELAKKLISKYHVIVQED
jgi:hypothetical protein